MLIRTKFTQKRIHTKNAIQRMWICTFCKEQHNGIAFCSTLFVVVVVVFIAAAAATTAKSCIIGAIGHRVVDVVINASVDVAIVLRQ